MQELYAWWQQKILDQELGDHLEKGMGLVRREYV